MTSTAFRTSVTAGQTAVGITTSTAYLAFIGFWQIDTASVGIREDAHWSAQEPLETRLYEPAPNPCFGHALIRYSLAGETHVALQVYDLTGRSRVVLANSVQKPGRYTLDFIPHSSFRNPQFPCGVYFVKLQAGDYQATRKLVIQ